MEALEALMSRRSTRNFCPAPVEQEKLDTILAAGRQAPSGGNNQTSHFLVIRNRQVLDTLISMVEKAFAGMEAETGEQRVCCLQCCGKLSLCR